MTESKLLQLPPEIRENIYRHLFRGAKAYVKTTPRSAYESDRSDDSDDGPQEDSRCHSQIFQLCKQLYQEAQPIQASLIHLDFNFGSSIDCISLEWQGKYLDSVKQVTVDFYWCRYTKFDHKNFPSLELLKVAATSSHVLDLQVKILNDGKRFIAGEHDERLAGIARKSCLRIWDGGWVLRAFKDPERSFKMISDFHAVPGYGENVHGIRCSKAVYDMDTLKIIERLECEDPDCDLVCDSEGDPD